MGGHTVIFAGKGSLPMLDPRDRLTRWMEIRQRLVDQNPLGKSITIISLLAIAWIPIYILNLMYPRLTVYTTSALATIAIWIAFEIKKQTGDWNWVMISMGAIYGGLVILILVMVILPGTYIS